MRDTNSIELRGRRALGGAAAVVLLVAGACGGGSEARLPTPEQARAIYEKSTPVDSVDLSGNVMEFHIHQPTTDLERGGSLWARVGPYIYLFSPATQQLLDRYPDLAGVRVIMTGPKGEEVARALLPRDTMSDIKWRRSLNLLGHALQEGTQKPARLEDLIDWGERNTQFEYNEKFLPR